MFSMFGKLTNLVVGKDGGASHSEIRNLHYHNTFSGHLPWFVYDPINRMYINSDDTVGFLWECTPLCFSGEKTVQISESIMRLSLPDFTVIQFILHADEDIKSVLDGYRDLRKDGDELCKTTCESYIDFLKQQSTKGTPRTAHIPLRNFRLFVSIKLQKSAKGLNLAELNSLLYETLNGLELSPRSLEPPQFLDWARRLFNSDLSPSYTTDANGATTYASEAYSDTRPLASQVVFAETDVECTFSHLRFGKKYLRSITPKTYPDEVNPLQTNELFGGIWGARCDNNQHRTPFLYCLNIIVEDMKNALRTKCDLVLQQHGIGSWARTLARKQEEYTWAIDRLDQGEKMIRVMPIMWFIGDSIAACNDSVTRAKRMWEESGYNMQEDKGILPVIFLSSLPFGLRASKQNLTMLLRDTIVTGEVVANLLPVQGGFAGTPEPVLIFNDRKGQICPLNIFSKRAINFNGIVLASTGAGKSFFMNSLAYGQSTVGTKIRIIDIGKSYKKLCLVKGGRFLDFSDEADVICLNPFTNIIDIDEDLPAISSVVCQMVYSGSANVTPNENEITLAKESVRWAYDNKGKDASIDQVWDYLRRYPDSAEEEGSRVSNVDIIGDAHKMAFNMRDFTSKGTYGKYFNGPSTFSISDDDFLCLELEALKVKPDLFKVVTLLVLDAVTRDLYLSDRSERRMVVFDEAWQFISGDNIMMQNIIESGFRRARKYNASFFVVSQSLMDLQLFGKIGGILWNNADYRFLLESKDFEKAHHEKIITYEPFTMELLKTVRTVKQKYSEIFMDTPVGRGIVRLSVDDFSYYLYTSDADETSEIETMISGGMTPTEAINAMVSKYRSFS
jgi:conjugal transfer ATP-binding protein TraC